MHSVQATLLSSRYTLFIAHGFPSCLWISILCLKLDFGYSQKSSLPNGYKKMKNLSADPPVFCGGSISTFNGTVDSETCGTRRETTD